MRIDNLTIHEIQYKKQEYCPALLESLKRVGLNFPIHVRVCESGYICRDGNKRLSAICDILKENPNDSHFQTIKVIIDDFARTPAPHSLHNHH